MNKMQEGDLFSFQLNNSNKYGLIQIISKQNDVYKVRVFEKVFTCLTNDEIDSIINSQDFYYLKRFYENDLIKYGKYIGNCSIPSFVSFPQYLRSSERKANGKLVWYIFNSTTGAVVKTLNKFDKSLEKLSPNRTWGIEYIKLRWQEGFTLFQWNDNLENKWYFNYLKQYEPNKLVKINKQFLEKNPTSNWTYMDEKAKENINNLLNKFTYELLNKYKTNEDIEFAINKLINDLNKINSIYSCIETIESEDLLEYLANVLFFVGYEDKFDIIDKKRQW